jgi:hypothetical protein
MSGVATHVWVELSATEVATLLVFVALIDAVG